MITMELWENMDGETIMKYSVFYEYYIEKKDEQSVK